MALRRKHPKNPQILFPEADKRRKTRKKEKAFGDFRVESLEALLAVSYILRSIASQKPLYGNRKKALLRAIMLFAFYLGYFHAPKNLIQHGKLGQFNLQRSKNNFS